MKQRNVTFDLIKHAEATPDAPALLLPDREISYFELNNLTWKCAQYLYEQGVRADHVVGLIFAEELALVLVMLAIIRLGATVFSIPRSATPIQRIDMAASAKIIVLLTDQPDRYDTGFPFLQVDWRGLSQAEVQIDPRILSEFPGSPCLLITGSGTTGQPKLIPVTHAQSRARSELISSCYKISPADRIAPLSHFDFVSSKFRLHEALISGASCGLQVWDSPNPILQCIKQAFTVVYAAVFHAEKMLAMLPQDSGNPLGAIRVFEVTSSMVTDDLRQRIKRSLCPNLYVRYATNEAGPVSITFPPEVYTVSGTVGKPLSGVRVQITDRSFNEVPADTIGLIRMKSPGLVDGYHDNVAASQQNFQDGWFLTGDLGKLTHDGQLIYCGRADHMMIMNGINIYPAEIEQVLTAHPAVHDAAAMPVKHKVHQEIPICAVTLHPQKAVSEHELLAYARERLGAHSPHLVLIVNRVPRNHQGKLIRAEMSRLILVKLGLASVKDVIANSHPPAGAKVIPHGQLALQFNLDFVVPKQAHLPCLDSWLTEILEIQISPPPSVIGQLAAHQKVQAEQWLWRALLLVRELMQAGQLPVFDSPRVISLGPNINAPGRWNATVTLALIDYLPHSAYLEVLSNAFRLCAWAASNQVNEKNLKTFFAALENQCIGRLAKMLPGGKSTLPVLRVAYEKGIPFIHLGGGVFQLGWGCKARRVDRSTTEFDSAMGGKLAQNKVLTARLLRMGGFPAPEHEVVGTEDDALKAAVRIGWPVVVKPADRDRGEGVTVDVTDESMLGMGVAQGARTWKIPGCRVPSSSGSRGDYPPKAGWRSSAAGLRRSTGRRLGFVRLSLLLGSTRVVRHLAGEGQVAALSGVPPHRARREQPTGARGQGALIHRQITGAFRHVSVPPPGSPIDRRRQAYGCAGTTRGAHLPR